MTATALVILCCASFGLGVLPGFAYCLWRRTMWEEASYWHGYSACEQCRQFDERVKQDMRKLWVGTAEAEHAEMN